MCLKKVCLRNHFFDLKTLNSLSVGVRKAFLMTDGIWRKKCKNFEMVKFIAITLKSILKLVKL